MSKSIQIGLAVVIGSIAFLCLLLEGASVDHYYIYEQAVIISVHTDRVTGWGDYNRTYVRYTDNSTDNCVGLLGQVGDKIRVSRKQGSQSLFGIFGDVSIREAKQLERESKEVKGNAQHSL